MTRYILDTDTLIDFSKGWEPTRSKLLQLIQGGDVLGVCAITIAEFYAGIPPENRLLWDEFFASLTYWGITREAAAAAGVDRYELARKGLSITTADSLIAAVAKEQHAIVLTSNTKDFPIEGLTVQSLRVDDA
jgi:predicted nucleic acid-binding protein